MSSASQELSLEEIVLRDLKNNYPDISPDQASEILEGYIENGAAFKRANNTLFIIFDYNGDAVKYHSINADPLRQYLENRILFFAYLYNQGKKQAITYFSNPKTKKLVDKHKLSIEQVIPSDDPDMGDFMLVTDLSGGE